MAKRMTAEEVRKLAGVVLSRPTIVNKYAWAADALARHVLESLESDDQRRERFERWVGEQCKLSNMRRGRDGDYKDGLIRCMWMSWQAALTYRDSEKRSV